MLHTDRPMYIPVPHKTGYGTLPDCVLDRRSCNAPPSARVAVSSPSASKILDSEFDLSRTDRPDFIVWFRS